MKKQYRFSSGEMVVANRRELREMQRQISEYLNNYQELLNSLDDESYIARGNGFCESKYSEDFVESQITKYRKRLAEIESWLLLADD